MDPASVIVARALEVKNGDRVLDMCAAPGGKTLILAEALKNQGEIFANDLSPERRDRLKKVIQQYKPPNNRDRVWVTGKDVLQFGLREPSSFDKVLLDAPCSGERHVLENKKAQEEWSPRRGENLATRQYALLCAALLAVKPGGRIVYSTCSINPAENDGVIDKLLRKKKDAAKVIPVETHELGEKTSHGCIFLPDQCGFGPLYYTVLERSADLEEEQS
jgi:16S rRNA C967 or C1407 C5-methylase (RsmB/RsmF family)